MRSRGVLDERAEARLAGAAMDLLGQRRALERERDLGRQGGEAALQRPRDPASRRRSRAARASRRGRRARAGGWTPTSGDAGAPRARSRTGWRGEPSLRRVRAAPPRSRRVTGHAARELGVGDDDAVALGQAEAGGHVVPGERARGGERGMADVGAAGGGDEVGAGGAEDPLARDGALLLAHEAGHAGHDEAEQDDRGDVDHEVVVALVDDLQQRHDRRDQRGAGERARAAAA